MRAPSRTRRFSGPARAAGDGQPDTRVIAARAAAVIAVALAAAGCPTDPGAPVCPDGHYLVAVAADGADPSTVYVADDFSRTAGYPYIVGHADTLQPILRTADDGTSLALLAPAAGGVVVVNGGAAARRFDATGAALWTIGYGASVGVTATLIDGDRLVVADKSSLRVFEADGTAGWELALPDTVEQVVQVIGDRSGGFWFVGQFEQNLAPWIASPPAGTSGGLFVLHFDAGGAVIGAGVDGFSNNEFTHPAVAAKDAAGAPMLVVPYFPNGSSPVAVAFDGTGKVLWSQSSTARLETDAEGNLLSISSGGGRAIDLARLDATGSQVASATFALAGTDTGDLSTTTAPVSGGILVAGEHVGSGGCPDQHFLLHVDTASLGVTSLKVGLLR
jgi:hypothetical protein